MEQIRNMVQAIRCEGGSGEAAAGTGRGLPVNAFFTNGPP
jgi:hypothetical protein